MEREERDSAERLRIPTQAPDCPRLRTVIGKEFEGMIERWRIDRIGFGERGEKERES